MQVQFCKKDIVKWVSAALAASPMFVSAAEPYPSLPPSLSTGVKPNILLYLDDSGSMGWPVNERAAESPTNPIRMPLAKKVITNLLSKKENRELNWGLHTFDYYRGNHLRTPIKDRTDKAAFDELVNQVNAVRPDAGTPLASTAYQTTLYWRGMGSYVGQSPIKYRCQKNFQIIITDGDPSGDTNLSAAMADPALRSYGIAVPSDGVGKVQNNLKRISQFMFEQDMRPSGTDMDGVDFNDAQFPKQNVSTYTVGFALDTQMLKDVAAASGGKYYTANNEKELTDSLTNALASILSQRSNAGGIAVASSVKSANNFAYQPLFNPDGWYGELSRYKITDGKIDTSSKLDAGLVLTNRGPDSRVILSAKLDKATVPFAFNDAAGLAAMSDKQKELLGGNTAEQQKIIRYIRGAKDKDLRERKSLLGDFIDTQPAFIGAPSSFSTESTFNSFKSAQKSRNMVFIGANDGMMHGFNAETMSEIGAYIPSMVYRNLKVLSNPKYGIAGGLDAPHVYHVSGAVATADVKASSGWKTYLVSGLGQGGQGYFALDVTSEKNFDNSSPKEAVKWELNDQNEPQIGYTFAKPVIWGVRDGGKIRPAVVLTNGYENDFDDGQSGGNKVAKIGVLYIVDIETGTLIKKIEVKDSKGLSAPHGVDDLADGVLDYVYAGDQEGNMWRFDLTDSDPKNFTVAEKPIFKAPGNQPIIQKPVVMEVHGEKSAGGETYRGNLVMFGTGKLLTTEDRNSTSGQALYGILDVMDKTPKTVQMSDLVEQKVLPTTATEKKGNFRVVTDNKVELKVEQKNDGSTKKGWYLNLPTSTERQTATPQILGDKVIFGTGVMTSTKVCTPGGAGWMMVLDPFTGSTPRSPKNNKKYSFIDINGDKKVNGGDKVKVGTMEEYVAGMELPGIPSEMTLVSETDPFNGWIRDTTKGKDEPQLGDSVGFQGVNSSGVSLVSSKAPLSENKAMPPGAKDCKGKIYIPTKGKEGVVDAELECPNLGVRVERTTWRELVQ
ncbi:pilus assembly protein [Chitinimonas sp. PSY-7]|uniref:PilC/PilY family type IV pilus protein n=1 Tax=Chitinimonas sp. PSY-7 TaxID=3459088 RepID=UPI0040400636